MLSEPLPESQSRTRFHADGRNASRHDVDQPRHWRAFQRRHSRRKAAWQAIGLLACGLLWSCSGPGRSASSSHAPASALDAARAEVHGASGDPGARVKLADQLIRSGETYAAIEQLEVASDLGDRDEDLVTRLAGLYDALGEPEAAVAALDRAGAKVSTTLALARSRARLKLGDFQGAADALAPLISQWPQLPADTRQYAVRTLLLAGDAEQANALLPAGASDAEWLSLIGLQALLSGQPARAVAALTQATMRAPQDVWNRYLLGRALLESGDARHALDAWMSAVGAPDAPAPACIGAGMLLAQAGRTAEAARALERVQGDDRRIPACWQAQSVIAQRSGQTVYAQIALGYAAYNSGDPWKAVAIWQAVLPRAQGADVREIYAGLYNSAARCQDLSAALRWATKANGLRPDDPYFLKARAELLLERNQLAQARAVAERLQAVAPPDQQVKAAELLSRIALDADDPKLLQSSAQRNRTLAPDDPVPLLHLAEWQAQQGQDHANLERTLSLYQQAGAVAPGDAESAAHIGMLLADLQRPQEAIVQLRHALTLGPRALEGAPIAVLTQLEAHQGMIPESRFEARQSRRLRDQKDGWPPLLKLMSQTQPAPTLSDWRALSSAASDRHETWIALCASERATRLAPRDPACWRSLAEALKRLGRFDEALNAMRRAHLLLHTVTHH